MPSPKMMSIRTLQCLLLVAPALALLAWPGSVRGHGDAETLQYVAGSGVDAGDCRDAGRPCASIGYALSRAGKGGQIRVLAGTYTIENAEDVFYLVSGVVSVTGGYRQGFAAAPEDRGVSTLIGVPHQYRELLRKNGFEVIADRKGIDTATADETDELLDLHQSLKASIAATPCTGGSAAGLPCSNVDLLSHVGFLDISRTPGAGNDVWGFVDLNTGREYAIAGFNLGTAVFDVTDATNPREVGFVDGQRATWRDIKVYQFFDAVADRFKAYAYVTTDGARDGLVVIDLAGLPHAIRRVDYRSDIASAHNVYATNTDYGTGVSLTGATPTLVIAGSDIGNGEYRAYSLADPSSPRHIGGGSGAGYMHDASSILITDERKDTQCANGGAQCEVLLDFNENTVAIWDITNAAAPVRLSAMTYPDVGYVHSGWWSEDRQIIYVHDELDERNLQLPTTLRAISVADLRNPVLLGGWTGPTSAIDHNGFVRGNRYYMSNYTRGLTVLDISDAASPVAVGRLDTYPVSDGTMYNGAWGAYPYFHSGNVAISDIDSGFYMAADRTREVAEGMLQFTSASFGATEGRQASLVVERVGGSSGGVTVGYEVLHLTADAGDYSASSGPGVLSWDAGDATNRSITLDVANDGLGEGMERLFVRLVNPGGGATLGNASTASVYFSDPGSTAEAGFLEATAGVAEAGFGTLVAVVRRDGSAIGPASVDYSMTAGDASPASDFLGDTSGTVRWSDGDAHPKVIEFVIVADGAAEGDETIELTLTNPVGLSLTALSKFTATIRDGDGANLAPNAVVGASQTRSAGSRVTLDGRQSNDPDGDTLSYRWTQTGGTAVTLEDAETAVASFTAPGVNADTLLGFQLTVTDPQGLADSATASVTVTRSGDGTQSGGGSGGGAFGLVSLLMLGAAPLCRRLSRKGCRKSAFEVV
jgi:choice-of-anchor B domain-containing protein